MTKKEALKIYESSLMGYFSQGTTVPCNASYEQAIYIAFDSLKREIEIDDRVERVSKNWKRGDNA